MAEAAAWVFVKMSKQKNSHGAALFCEVKAQLIYSVKRCAHFTNLKCWNALTRCPFRSGNLIMSRMNNVWGEMSSQRIFCWRSLSSLKCIKCEGWWIKNELTPEESLFYGSVCCFGVAYNGRVSLRFGRTTIGFAIWFGKQAIVLAFLASSFSLSGTLRIWNFWSFFYLSNF